MWPNLENLLTDEQLNALDQNFSIDLKKFIENENIDGEFQLSIKALYLPLAKWIESQCLSNKQNVPVIFGINGAQGSGKSTLCRLLVLMLETLFNKRVLHLSIDDLYLSKNQRQLMANTIHPLFKVRGVPGTHDVPLGIDILNRVKHAKNSTITLPVFDKSIDDLIPEDKWPTLKNNFDIVLFEGWCVGAKPQLKEVLNKPVNELEINDDAQCIWRRYVNQQLAQEYAELFSCLDFLIMMEVPGMESIYEWRKLQEDKLRSAKKFKDKDKNQIMSDAELTRFMMHFERTTRACLQEMPQRADVLLTLNKAHQVEHVRLR